MENNIFTKILRAQNKNQKTMLDLLKQFEPLIRSYSNKLNYEDAYNDLQLFFIEMINNIELSEIKNKDDKVFLYYFKLSVKNHYIKKSKEYNARCLTEDYYKSYEDVIQNISVEDEYSYLLFQGFKDVLTELEYEVIYKMYFDKYTGEEIARSKNVSRQYVNKVKKKALTKIELKIN